MLPAKLKGLLAIGVVGALSVQVALAVYIPTAHDTKLPPETITYPITYTHRCDALNDHRRFVVLL
jgi:hypothetical protein